MRNSEIILVSPSLVRLLSFDSLEMPLFQRHYSWGTADPSAENKGIEYFENFLINRSGSTYFGQINLFSSERWEYLKGEGISVGVSDGQHRLATVLISALALKERLLTTVHKDLTNLSEEQRIRLDEDIETSQEFLNCAEIKKLLSSSLKVVPSPAESPVVLIIYIKDRLSEISHLRKKLMDLEKSYEEKKIFIRKTYEKEKKTSKLKEASFLYSKQKKETQEKIDLICSVGVVSTFLKISTSLDYLSDSAAARYAERFRFRIKELKVSAVCLQPAQGETVDSSSIEAEAFSMFAQLNGQALPLTAGELLKSFMESKSSSDSLLKGILGSNSKEKDCLEYFGISDYDLLAEFFAKIKIGHGNTKSYTWVKSALYSNAKSENLVLELENWILILKKVYEKILNLDALYKKLFQMFFSGFSRVTNAIYIARCFSTKPPEYSDLINLLKVLILMELAITYRGPSGSRFNIVRDLPGLDLNTIEAGLSFATNHFTKNTNKSLEEVLRIHLAKEPLAQTKTRLLSKILLILEDVSIGVKDIDIADRFTLEHTFPQKWGTIVESEKDIPEKVYESILEIAQMEDYPRHCLINSLGNSMLMGSAVNSSLSNSSPFKKFTMQDEDTTLINAWWPSHLRDIQDSKGIFGKNEIEKRSLRIAHNVSKFLSSVDTVLD